MLIGREDLRPTSAKIDRLGEALCGLDWSRRSRCVTGDPPLSETISDKWFRVENLIAVWPIPLIAAVLFIRLWRSLSRLPVRLAQGNEYGVWVPFYTTIGLFMLAFHGLAYSLFPWLVVDQMTIWDAAAAPESLWVILIGATVVLPVMVGYSLLVYRIFGGKAKPLKYY